MPAFDRDEVERGHGFHVEEEGGGLEVSRAVGCGREGFGEADGALVQRDVGVCGALLGDERAVEPG